MITDLGMLGPREGYSNTIVCREPDDPYKHRDYYPTRREGDPPPAFPQRCLPHMDVHAYGKLLNVLDALTKGSVR